MSTGLPRFLRQDTNRHHRLGRKRKKLQKWRRPRGRHSKVRRKRFSYPIKVMVGFKQEVAKAHQIYGLSPILVHNVKEISKLDHKKQIAIIARVGAKNRIAMLKAAGEKGIKVANISQEASK